MNALIVAAGLSQRLRPLTDTLPKGLLTINGQTLLGRSVALLRWAGVAEIVVVVGYRQEQIQAHLGNGVRYVENPFYAETNNMFSLWFGLRTMAPEPLLYLHGDLIFAPALLERLLAGAQERQAALLVDYGPADEEAMKVRVERGRFLESDKAIPVAEAAGEWTGVARFSPAAIPPLLRAVGDLLGEGQFQAYDTAAFSRMAAEQFEFGLVPTDGLPWAEIDTPEDLARARALFEQGTQG